ncbi:MAG: hypothetical protein JKY49_07290 [Cohaesibacteraceae bacterium]|nr:hypothetical protein [Cohaesibacteraceae bacterium]MBL4874989.1 hypothetical protein [Cohaesibacteraceae bacterium]
MAILAQNYLTLVDIYKRQEGDGRQIAAIIELLAQENQILADAVAMECNMGTKHRHTIRTGLPSVSWGMLYKGTPQSKSQTQQVDDTTGFIEAMSSVDCRLLDLATDRGAVRLSEGQAFLEAMNQEMATGMFYHDTANNPERFKGLSARYATYANGANSQGAEKQVIHAGGAGSDNTSIWFVTWGDRFTHLIYPKGTKAGVQRQDMGKQRVLDADNNPYYVEEEMFTWHMGVAVKDWRYNARICNIDVSDVQGGSVDLYKLMRKAYYQLQSRRVAGGKQCIYMNKDMMEALDALATNAGTSDNFVRLGRREIEGQQVITYRGIPIRETDALLNTEAAVPAAS